MYTYRHKIWWQTLQIGYTCLFSGQIRSILGCNFQMPQMNLILSKKIRGCQIDGCVAQWVVLGYNWGSRVRSPAGTDGWTRFLSPEGSFHPTVKMEPGVKQPFWVVGKVANIVRPRREPWLASQASCPRLWETMRWIMKLHHVRLK